MNENENRTFADVIVELRKEKGFTQQDLANKLHITDKAVSKWERGLSYPDITSISTLANVLDVDSSYLIDLCKSEDNPYLESDEKEDIKKIIQTILKGIGLAMGVSVAVLNIMNQLSVKDSIIMLSIGLACFGISSISNEKSEEKKLIKKK
jgi:transcriptional regulator with XRE-family HTH domain